MKKHYLAIHFRKPQAEIEILAELCLRLTPSLVIRKKEVLFLEWGKSKSLISLEGMKRRVDILFRRRNASFGAGAGNSLEREKDYFFSDGPSIPEALVNGKYGKSRNEAPIESIEHWVDPLAENPEWGSALSKMSEALFWLGVRQIGQIDRLEKAGFVSRFGKIGTTLLDRLADPESLQPVFFRPPEHWSERKELWDFGGAEDLSLYLFEIKILLDRLLQRLFSRGRSITAMKILLEEEARLGVRSVFAEIELRFTFPQSDAKAILKLIQEKLSRKLGERDAELARELSTPTPVAAIQLEVFETLARREGQMGFLQEAEERAERFQGLVSQLAVKLEEKGDFFQAELVESHRPEGSWMKTLKIPDLLPEILQPIPLRPIRFFPIPEKLHRLGRFLIWNGKRFPIRELSQMEKIQTEWWMEDDGVHRTYFKVNSDGIAFWIFRDERSPGREIYLQGIF